MHDGITREISAQLRPQLAGEEKARVAKRYTESTEAYHLYLKGRYHWNRRTPADLKKAVEYFEQAVAEDPTYSLAYAGLTEAYVLLPEYRVVAPREAIPKARAAVMKALQIDSTLAEAHAVFAESIFKNDFAWTEAEKRFRRAIELNPNYPTAHQWYAEFLSFQGRHDEALVEIQKAQELDPTSLVINGTLGEILARGGHPDRGIEQCKKTLELDPNFAVAHDQLGFIYLQKGMPEEALRAFQKALANSPDSSDLKARLGYAYARSGSRREAQTILEELKDLSKRSYVSAYDIAALYAGLGQKDEAFVWLERAYQERSSWLVWLKVDPQFDSLRSDSRFQDLLRRIGLRP